MDNYKNNKRKFSEPKENSLKKRKQDSIFNIITTDIWKIIFQFIYESVNYNALYMSVTYSVFLGVFKKIRLTCKLFRELSLPYWVQHISKTELKPYFAQNNLESVHKVFINGAIFINLKNDKSEGYLKGFSTACKHGLLPIVKKMVKDGANVNQVNLKNGLIPIFYASLYSHLETMKFLIENGAIYKPSMLINLYPQLNTGVVKILIGNGLDINIKNSFEESVLKFIEKLFEKEGLDYPKINVQN